eukprot:405046-Lingulodinium_polyedra.AAC.1
MMTALTTLLMDQGSPAACPCLGAGPAGRRGGKGFARARAGGSPPSGTARPRNCTTSGDAGGAR